MTLEEWIAETEAERPERALWPSAGLPGPSPDATGREFPSTRACPSDIISGRFARASWSRPRDSADFAGAAFSA